MPTCLTLLILKYYLMAAEAVTVRCFAGDWYLLVGVFHLHLRCADRVLHGSLPGEEEDNLTDC